MTLGEKIKLYRKEKGYTQKEFADLIDAKYNSVSDWENDKHKPDVDTLERICGVLELSPAHLINSNEELLHHSVDMAFGNFEHLLRLAYDDVFPCLDRSDGGYIVTKDGVRQHVSDHVVIESLDFISKMLPAVIDLLIRQEEKNRSSNEP